MSNALALAITEDETAAETAAVAPTLALYGVHVGEDDGAPDLGHLPATMMIYATDPQAAWDAYALATGLFVRNEEGLKDTPLMDALTDGLAAGTVMVMVEPLAGTIEYIPPKEATAGDGEKCASDEEREAEAERHAEDPATE
jgi:hypothetical protein